MRVILVTGGNGALGIAIARAFLTEDEKCRVWIGVRERREAAEAVRRAFPERVGLVDLDVTSRAAWDATVQAILAANGHLDVLVNNAGIHEDSLLATMPEESWSRVISTNLESVFHGCQAALPPMISQRSGRIVNIASLSALLAPAGQTNYAAAKAGVVALTSSLAKEMARLNITVNAVCPGYLDTPALGSLSQDKRQAALVQIPMRRFGRVEEIAAAVVFLASPSASYVTGATLKVDGGVF